MGITWLVYRYKTKHHTRKSHLSKHYSHGHQNGEHNIGRQQTKNVDSECKKKHCILLLLLCWYYCYRCSYSGKRKKKVQTDKKIKEKETSPASVSNRLMLYMWRVCVRAGWLFQSKTRLISAEVLCERKIAGTFDWRILELFNVRCMNKCLWACVIYVTWLGLVQLFWIQVDTWWLSQTKNIAHLVCFILTIPYSLSFFLFWWFFFSLPLSPPLPLSLLLPIIF